MQSRLEATLAALALLVARFWTPPDNPAWSVCGFFRLTGLPCPLCGLTRGFCAAAKGEWMQAAGFHALSPALPPLVAAWLAISLWRASGRKLEIPAAGRWQATSAVLLAAYGIFRIAARTL